MTRSKILSGGSKFVDQCFKTLLFESEAYNIHTTHFKYRGNWIIYDSEYFAIFVSKTIFVIMFTAYKNWVFCLPDNILSTIFVCYEKFLNPKHRRLHNFWHYNISLLKNIKINCPHNTVQIDVLRIKPTVPYDTNSVIRKHFSTKFTVQYKPSQAKLGELCQPPGKMAYRKIA